jgi:hypothetical protein
LNSDTQGGAWCPREPVSQEKEDQYLEVDLGSTHVIAEVLTQGRFANGQGQEYAQAYRIHYWRPGLLEFKEYRDSMGKTVSCRSFILKLVEFIMMEKKEVLSYWEFYLMNIFHSMPM